MKIARSLASLALIVWALAPLPAAAGVVQECSLDEPSGVLTVTIQGDGVSLHVADGDEIWADGAPCDGATTTNTDDVVVVAGELDMVELDLSGGAFAPGKSDEGDGSSEIEFEVTFGPVVLSIVGSNGPDQVTARSAPAGSLANFNLNAEEASADADLLVHHDVLLSIDIGLEGGADRFEAGAVPDGDRAFRGPGVVRGGAGRDVIEPGIGEVAYWGDEAAASVGAAPDVLTVQWLPRACDAVVTNGPPSIGGSWFDCGNGPLPWRAGLFERIVGHAGADYLFGGGGPESFVGGKRNDTITPGRGADEVDGEGGWDAIVVGRWSPVVVDLTARRIAGEGGDRYERMEGIYSVNPGRDVFEGEPSPILDNVGGGDGDDILDLRFASHGLMIFASNDNLPLMDSIALIASSVTVFGTSFDDEIVGGAIGTDGPDRFRGFGGDDFLEGGPGPDDIEGGRGDDLIEGNGGTDRCRGGPGIDVIRSCEL